MNKQKIDMDIYDEILNSYEKTKNDPNEKEIQFCKLIIKIMQSKSLEPELESSLIFLMGIFESKTHLYSKSGTDHKKFDPIQESLVKLVLLEEYLYSKDIDRFLTIE